MGVRGRGDGRRGGGARKVVLMGDATNSSEGVGAARGCGQPVGQTRHDRST